MRRNLGLDELMIVNPAAPAGSGREAILSGDFFLAGDGSLYRIEDAGPAEETSVPGQFFLGEDGTLYRLVSEPDKRKP
jgi:hypothetical protein